MNAALIEWRGADGWLGVQQVDVQAEILRLISGVSGPVLQIGSKADLLDRVPKWRSRFSGPFVGLDLEDGDNVDVVGDIGGDLAVLRRKLGVTQFGFIICAHVLEHVKQPWVAARNIERLLKPGAHVFVTVPWVQGYHPFPDDFWRMSFDGVRALFPAVGFSDEFYSGAAETVGYRLVRNGAGEHSRATCQIERNLFQLMIEPMPRQRIFDDQDGDKLALSRLYMPACSVNLFGQKLRRSAT